MLSQFLFLMVADHPRHAGNILKRLLMIELNQDHPRHAGNMSEAVL